MTFLLESFLSEVSKNAQTAGGRNGWCTTHKPKFTQLTHRICKLVLIVSFFPMCFVIRILCIRKLKLYLYAAVHYIIQRLLFFPFFCFVLQCEQLIGPPGTFENASTKHIYIVWIVLLNTNQHNFILLHRSSRPSRTARWKRSRRSKRRSSK